MGTGAGRRARTLATLGLMSVLLWTAADAARGADVAPEPVVKAEFIERISRLVDWPDDTFAGAGTPFAMCMVGDDGFAEYLLKLSKGRKIQGRPITLTHVADLGRLGMCNLVFIAHGEEKHLEKILQQTEGRPILTFADSVGFSERGVLVNFYRSGDNLRFEINVAAVDKSGLHVSSKILRLARLTGKKP